jgi:phosphate-selective porin OprO/OprP
MNNLRFQVYRVSIAKVITYRILIFLLLLFFVYVPTYSQSEYITPDGNGEITFIPGLRIQPRYEHNAVDKNNDFYIARLRLKGSGKAFNLASYYFEVKIDNAGRFNKEQKPQVENAWLNFLLSKDINLRVGFYDMVFSRNALTSDSKLLLMDRSLIKDALTVIGVADNTVGLLLHGRPLGNHLSYGFGIFDNIAFEIAGKDSTILQRKSDGAMTTARVVYDFLDPAPANGYGDYQGSYIGKGQRLSLGTNGSYLTNVRLGEVLYDELFAWGADIFFNTGPYTFEAEYDLYNQISKGSSNSSIKGFGYYLQAGYLILPMLEFAIRYQQLDPNKNGADDKLYWTTIGFNFYMHGHNLKIQTDYTFKNEQNVKYDDDLFQIQLQLDF